MSKEKSKANTAMAILFWWFAFLYLFYSANISQWIPTISLLYWFARGTMGRPRTGKRTILTMVYQLANMSVVGANAIVLASAFSSLSAGHFYRKLIEDAPRFWGSHHQILAYPAEAFIMTSAFLLPISAIIFSGGAIAYIVKNEWYASWRFERAKRNFFKDIS
jgi:hypothetical protein